LEAPDIPGLAKMSTIAYITRAISNLIRSLSYVARAEKVAINGGAGAGGCRGQAQS